MNRITQYNERTFEDIKHIDTNGCEYWEARELQNVLEYKRWDKFCNVIDAAKVACEKSNNEVFEHFSHLGKTSKMPNNGVKNPNNPGDVIIKWMSNKSSFDFYCLWKELFNEDFKLSESR